MCYLEPSWFAYMGVRICLPVIPEMVKLGEQHFTSLYKFITKLTLHHTTSYYTLPKIAKVEG